MELSSVYPPITPGTTLIGQIRLVTTRGVACTVLDARKVALRTDGNLYINPDEAQRVSNDHQDSLGIVLGDLADRTQWMRDMAFTDTLWDTAGPALEEYLGDAAYLGDRWMVYAHITRTVRVVRYIGYPMHNADGSAVAAPVAVAL